MSEEVNQPSADDILRAKMIEGGLVASGLMSTIMTQIEQGIAEGKVTIQDAMKHREVMVLQAAQTMARGIEGAFKILTDAGYIIVKQEGEENGEDTSVAAQGRTEPKGGSEREGESLSESGGAQPESSGEGYPLGA